MTTKEIVRRSFRLLIKTGIGLGFLACAGVLVWLTIMMIEFQPGSVWVQILAVNHTVFVGVLVYNAWQVMAEPPDTRADNARLQQ